MFLFHKNNDINIFLQQKKVWEEYERTRRGLALKCDICAMCLFLFHGFSRQNQAKFVRYCSIIIEHISQRQQFFLKLLFWIVNREKEKEKKSKRKCVWRVVKVVRRESRSCLGTPTMIGGCDPQTLIAYQYQYR